MAQIAYFVVSLIALVSFSDARRLLVNTAAYGYQDSNPANVQPYDSTSYQAQQQQPPQQQQQQAQSSTAGSGYQPAAGSATSLQAQQQPVTSTSAASSNSDSLPSFELPGLPQIKAFFDSLPKPPSLGPGPFDDLFGPAPAPAPAQAFAPMAALG